MPDNNPVEPSTTEETVSAEDKNLDNQISPGLIESDDDRKLADLLSEKLEHPKEPIASESDTEKSKEEPDDQGESKDEEPSLDSQDYMDAIQVLRRGKVPTALIDRLGKDEAVKMAADLKPIQADGDTLGNKYAQMKQELEELKNSKTEDVEPDLTPYKNSLSGLEDDIGKEASEAIAKLLAKRDIEQKSAFDKKVAALEERVHGLASSQYHRELTASRDALVSEFPRLKNAASYDAVLERTQSLMSTSDSWERYRGDLKEAMRDAAKLEIGNRTDKFAAEHNARVTSQQSTEQDTTVVASKPLDRDTADDMVLEALESGDKDLASEIEARFQRENNIN